MQKSNAFRFKQFAVTQERAAMKVGTDGVLLGAWVSLEGALRRVLDVGTGTGVIALMLAQRTATEAEPPVIDAVEVDSEAAREAEANFAASPWATRLRAYDAAIQSYTTDYGEAKYDLIVSNPPYFMAGTDFRRGFDRSAVATQPTAARVAARHAEALPYDELIDAVSGVLEGENGRFAAIFPYREAGIFVAKAAARGLYAHRMLEVRGTLHKPVKRMAIEFSFRRPKPEAIVREELCIEDGEGHFTEVYRSLTKDFYLRF